MVAGTDNAVLMVESEADLLSEEQMLGAVVFGHDQQQVVIQNINELVKEAGKEKWDWQPEPVNQALHDRVAQLAESRMGDAYRITEKQERYAQVDLIKEEVTAVLVAEDENVDVSEVADILASLENKLFVAVLSVVSHVSMAAKKIWFVHWTFVRGSATYSWFCVVYSW